MPSFVKPIYCTLLAVALCAATFASAAELHLRSEAAPSGALVVLGDVAEILAVGEAETQQLARIELFPAPPTGSSRLVRAGEVRDTLARRGIDLRQVRFVGASSIWIHGGGNVPPAPAPVAGEEKRLAPTAQVVVPLRPLRRGDVIRASDVQLQSRPAESAAAAAQHIEDVVGKQALRPVPQGSVIPLAELQSPPLVHKGEIVTVYARTRGVQVRTSAKALEGGARGDVIALASLLDRDAHFTARVIGTKEVEIFAGAPLVSQPPRDAAPAAPPAETPRTTLFGLRVRGQQH